MCILCKIYYVYIFVDLQERDFNDSRSSLNYSSTSLPPSPNKGNYFVSDSPPTLHPSGEFTKISR